MTRNDLEQVLRMAAAYTDHHPTAKDDPVLQTAFYAVNAFWSKLDSHTVAELLRAAEFWMEETGSEKAELYGRGYDYDDDLAKWRETRVNLIGLLRHLRPCASALGVDAVKEVI